MGAIEEDASQRAALVHREMLCVIALIAAVILAFVVTRAVAAANRGLTARDAEEWYRRGRTAIAAGRLDQGVDALRRAVVRRRSDRTYGLALADALASQGERDAARRQLLQLRADAPEDPEINLALARLAAAGGDVEQAQRYYDSALYAPWSPQRADARRRVRMELIRLLAEHGRGSRALAELIAVSPDVPESVRDQVEVAQLFDAAGDPRRALEHFQRALRHASGDPAALAGAGIAAFRLGDYARARTYLSGVRQGSTRVNDTRELVELVLTNDPLAARLGAAERRRRLAADLDRVRERLDECPGVLATPDANVLRAELSAFAPRLTARQALDQDIVEDGLNLAGRIERYAMEHCPPARPLDRALVLIAGQHGTAPQ